MTTARKLLTADDLLAMPDDGKKYELVRGELIEMPPPGFSHGVVTARLGMRFGHFIEENNLPFIYGTETGIYIERGPDTVRAADFNVISLERISAPIPDRGYVFGVVPDLVLEVISPGYSGTAADARARMWLEAGVQLVVVAYIGTQEIVTHGEDGTVQRFGMNDALTGAPVLPGFTCPVSDIFAYR
jgi:Uma2 family endonuclease